MAYPSEDISLDEAFAVMRQLEKQGAAYVRIRGLLVAAREVVDQQDRLTKQIAQLEAEKVKVESEYQAAVARAAEKKQQLDKTLADVEQQHQVRQSAAESETASKVAAYERKVKAAEASAAQRLSALSAQISAAEGKERDAAEKYKGTMQKREAEIAQVQGTLNRLRAELHRLQQQFAGV